jgi:hypothetical protein
MREDLTQAYVTACGLQPCFNPAMILAAESSSIDQKKKRKHSLL